MTTPENLKSYLSEIKSNFKLDLGETGYVVLFNSGQRGLKSFHASLSSILQTLKDIEKNIDLFSKEMRYEEKTWRDLGSEHFTDLTLNSLVTVQTKPVFSTLTKLISWANSIPTEKVNDENCPISNQNISQAIDAISTLITYYLPKEESPKKFSIENISSTIIPKPFLILAGISGTGKSRYVKNQASIHNTEERSNYRLIPVRPDWHEPSDLMGYVSGINTPRYMATEFLIFIVAAWKNAFASADKSGISLKPIDQITTYWLCLDEMNLAPVEQYFADYLAVIETREWKNNDYKCHPLLKAEAFNTQAIVASQLRKDLELNDAVFDGLWEYFSTTGIPLPPNLIVAGTVNMDETTHGFSRKVIDRAFSIDFGAFFPNDFSLYFGGQPLNKKLSFSVLTSVSKEDLQDIKADPDGARSIAFISRINDILANTPFELAYRALNELLLSVVCFQPETDIQLQAVWDDFLMTKVLPRIEGDAQKLQVTGQSSLLSKLTQQAKAVLNGIWDTERPDLLRSANDGGELLIPCRSKQKLSWMEKRLSENEFTSFWP